MAQNELMTNHFQPVSDERIEELYASAEVEQNFVENDSYTVTIIKRFLNNKLAVFSLIVFVLIVLVALFADVLAPFPRDETVGAFQAAPDSVHLLGTDSVGRDNLSRLIHGTQVSLIVGFGSTLISVAIGTTIGLVAGYFGGWVDSLLMSITEAFQSIPYFLAVLTMVSILSSGLWTVTIIMGILGWARLSRIVRGEVLSLKGQDFVLAAEASGYSTGGILFRHILPNLISPILVNATFSVANNILTESSLSFLGVGVEPPRPSWGNILSEAQSLNVLTTQPWRWIPAGLLIFITVFCVNFIGEGLRQAIEGEEDY